MTHASWWSGPRPPEFDRLDQHQQLILHCLYCPVLPKDRDRITAEAVAAASDFPTYLSKRLGDAMTPAGPGIETHRQLLAAGLLTYGQIEMVEVILNNMPPGLSPDQATGYCVAAPSNILSQLLPLPNSLKARDPYFVVDEVQVRQWFEKHRSDLTWDAAGAQFHLVR